MNKSGGSEMVKTGSQVLDSICISEAEKQAVLTLIREEVHTLITLIQHEVQFAFNSLCLMPLDSSIEQLQLTEHVSFQIITKEVEANDWKKKYEVSRQEVAEMRLELMWLFAFLLAAGSFGEMEKCPLLTWTMMDWGGDALEML